MTKDIPFGTGVIVVKDGKVLVGTRTDNGMICGPGGHILEGEDIPSAARREAQEEFSVIPDRMVPLGAVRSAEGKYKPSMVYLCTAYTGTPRADGEEMQDARFESIFNLLQSKNLFPVFADSLMLLMNAIRMHSDGGPGSGNWGHSSVKGVRGGSAPGGGSANRLGTKEGGFTSEAKAWAENKKKNKKATSGGESSSKTHLQKALESGDPEQLAKAIKDAKPGQTVKYVGVIHSFDYMKMSDDSWIKLQNGYDVSEAEMEELTKSQTQKFSTSDMPDQDFDACQKKFDTAMEVDNSAQKPVQDTYDKVLNTAHELPIGARYESPNGEVFVKLSDGSWEYKGKYEDSNVSEEDIAEYLAYAVHKGAVGSVKKHAYGGQVPESSGSSSGSTKASNETFDEEKYSQQRKDNATWNEPKQEIHDKLVENSGEEWKNATDAERQAIYDYTDCYYGTMNRALYSKDTAEELGEIYNGAKYKERIDGTTDYLDKCSTKTDVWAQRGTDQQYGPGILGISQDEFNRRLANNDFDDLIGNTTVQEGFLSTSPRKGEGFDGDLVLNLYIPAGSHAAYAEPFSCHGAGAEKGWDGSKETTNQGGVFGEFEMVVQRGSTLKITKIEVKNGIMYVDVDVATADKSDLKTLD